MKWFIAFLFCINGLYAEETIPSREVFFGTEQKTAVRVSPDGKKISYLAPFDGVMNVWVGDLDKDNAKPVTVVTDRSLSGYVWAPNSRHILFTKDSGGDENDHVHVLNLLTSEAKDLTPEAGVKAEVLKVSDKFPNKILVKTNSRDRSVFDVYEIDISTGMQRMRFLNQEGYVELVSDDDFVVRAAKKLTDRGVDILVRKKENTPFALLRSYDLNELENVALLQFSPDGQDLYFTDADKSNYTSLKKYHFPTRTVEVVKESSHGDFNGVVFDPLTGKPEIIHSYYLKLIESYVAEDLKRVWNAAKAIANNEPIVAVNRGKYHPYWTFMTKSDTNAGRFYLFNSKTLKGHFLFPANSALDSVKLAETKTVTIAARDGLVLPSYITRPMGVKGPGPTILLVHGGPWARDYFEYSPWRQFLASRGYNVLQVNFRGSSGLGKKHLDAGDRQWAKKMHDDLIDAVNWAVKNKIAEPKKVAIMGGSYGGYATLVGLTLTPEVFAAGVDIVGPSHVKTLLSTIPPYWKPMLGKLQQRVAPLDDEAFLDAISPLTHADNIRRPLLVLQGKNDPRVKEAESEQIVNSLVKKEIPVSYVVFPDEGHGFRMSNNQLAAIAIIEHFLAKHLGGKRTPLGDALKNSSAVVPVGKELVVDTENRD